MTAQITGQISILDITPDIVPPPEYLKCYETCAYYGLEMDTFPGCPDKPRCLYGYNQMKREGKRSCFKTILVDNVWHSWCIYYRRKSILDECAEGAKV